MEMYDILSRESENTQDVYLYEVGGHWYAYGRSAQLIKQLQQGLVKMKQFVNSTYGSVIDQVEVDFKATIEKCTIIPCSDSEMVLKC